MFTLIEIADIVKAKNDISRWSEVIIKGVEFDTRKVVENSLFVPLKGTRDGHEFIDLAIENGASVSFWEEGTSYPKPKDFPLLIVEDCLQAMQDLAHYFVKKIAPRVVGITGSNGKTTTKDMVASVLSQKFKTYKTQGNFNNEIGLPYTILHMPSDTETLVLEMGMNHKDEIRPLSLLAEPEVAAITIIGESHLEYLGSRQGVAEAKMEITEGLSHNGELIVPGEEPLLTSLLANLPQNIVTFGQKGTEDVTADIVDRTKTAITFVTNHFAGRKFTIPVVGDYNVNNALIAIAVGEYFGLSEDDIYAGLASLRLTHSRAEWRKAWNGADILNDAYNANPTAMRLVLKTFGQIDLEPMGKRVAVLADMGELGTDSAAMHREMSDVIDSEKISVVLLYGQWMKNLAVELAEKEEMTYFYFPLEEREALIKKIKEVLQPQDIILFKGSNSMKLAEIVEGISRKQD
ncbi:UDP-N-acetylmuramoyl-tripeptide--D-alanyl-D-alanine ligase [Vagococcus elongatus]|uniref:UDP-N-acetylmuramoyl-tripeptide--D-alanyl-D-alanine ligase n=1 Tax=Vagococcus elongatus TaxID=180344 RepID=A0A430AYD7_9ENTE|nr:UDP-N-acetylmuramoyl-tripeptide--D-alanyl-D-alanine ligase [Vagococcus elongatus]RSU13090.1 hypothetical protein CBF29_05320 [Vagococcus elongatus]